MSSPALLGPFHHVGVAVRDIDQAAADLIRICAAVPETAVIHDRNLRVLVRFVRFGDLRVELISPADSPSPLDSILKRGISLYHVCHEVDDLDQVLGRLQGSGAKVVSEPVSAAAFDNRRIAFVLVHGLMVELLEARPPGE